MQEHYRGAWHANVVTKCASLDSSSKISGAFVLTHADIGFHYRIRADYVRRTKDTTNLSGDGAWQFLMVEN